ncbi:Glycoside hydrolase, family 15 [Bosea sp. LC85]|uniref:glycoside hydrolase family 15 protein n=1 Tax=Bosea sp. LC85 TaxID=1502851 RepID=UPI0004E31805|nr:glycoside hydrolase family 15 protein [Bosea sp. LC85]KFC74558.1 Glycoside hydrolase, family 15 [Bosea sp. LC85]
MQPWQPPIEDYGIIGDCRTAALISREGSIDWLCLPGFSDPSVFGGILDYRTGGSFLVGPREEAAISRRYLERTPVLETIFETADGTIRLIDLVPVLDGLNTCQPMREMLRIVEGVSGETDLEIRIEPRPNYGRTRPWIRNRGRLGWSYSWSNELLTVHADVSLERAGDALQGSVRVRAGERLCLSLCYVKGDLDVLPLLGEDADGRLARTVSWWQGWAGRCSYDGPYKEAVLRSALTLKLLSFSLSGAIIAAPTASLPEAIGGARNWDYRYCWLRDAGLTMQAFVGLELQTEARSFLDWLLHATRLSWPELQVVYDVYGRTRLPEDELDHFAGYRGSRPVRIGNGAYSQVQLDVYGEVIFAADAYVGGGGTLEPVECRMLAGFGKVVCKTWRDADHGIWEKRDKRRHYTFSKLMCWLALDRLLRLNEKAVLSLGGLADRFGRERGLIADVIERQGFNPKIASYTGELDGTTVDASLLLMPCIGYRPADDPRVLSTYQRISDRLGRNGLLYRYERESAAPGSDEGAFGICSFWAAHHLACRGDVEAARRLFEHVLSFGNELGLFGEEIDPETGAALGNFPQAFTHVGLINAAIAIEKAAKS